MSTRHRPSGVENAVTLANDSTNATPSPTSSSVFEGRNGWWSVISSVPSRMREESSSRDTAMRHLRCGLRGLAAGERRRHERHLRCGPNGLRGRGTPRTRAAPTACVAGERRGHERPHRPAWPGNANTIMGMTAIDGRTARAVRTREAIVDACIALVDEGDVRPTALKVAERAGVSVRSVFQHFDDLEGLYAAIANRLVDRLGGVKVVVDAELPLGAAHHRDGPQPVARPRDPHAGPAGGGSARAVLAGDTGATPGRPRHAAGRARAGVRRRAGEA